MITPRKVSDEERRQMIASTAYFRAERRGFAGNDAWADWFEAEAEVDTRLDEQEQKSLFERLEERLAVVESKLKSARAKLQDMTSEAREEWERDIDKLEEARDRFRKRFAELRQKGIHAGEKAQARAEKISDEVTEALQRIEKRLRSRD